jgi:hypothetical protein
MKSSTSLIETDYLCMTNELQGGNIKLSINFICYSSVSTQLFYFVLFFYQVMTLSNITVFFICNCRILKFMLESDSYFPHW